ncbi:MAG: glutamyl-tRNA reductase [Chloroflexi bacterium]|nr:glutamyl-tRNA reductase [Chloroflexota bacterium]MCI0580456.1 glutamyl-tRNA reductase [Chloroflexota bacterium]MCI0649200.1 glutamyl-tRNA reductase [Chloroflexota bacterium]MCI0727988.1 glutamyl-tRNA reductase [Chloroflexota bacterium]
MLVDRIVCLGLNHRTAPVELRERVQCSLAGLNESGQSPAVQTAARNRFPELRELALLSTCNRLELYALLETAGARQPHDLLLDLLAGIHGLGFQAINNHLYNHTGRPAITHLCRVAAGLDSLVLGESQILGQVNDAFQAAAAAGTAGPALAALFRAAVRAGKRARTETAIGHNPASVSSVAVALVQEAAGELQQRRVLIVGAGEMGQLALKALHSRGIHDVTIVNRTVARAAAVAAQWGYRACSLEELPQALGTADVVISATGARYPIIREPLVRQALDQRNGAGLIFVDLAVPRDVETAVRHLPGVRLFDMDDLKSTLDESLAARQREVPKVEMIIAEEVEALAAEWQRLAVHPLIGDLRQKAERIRQRELQRTLRRLGDVDPATVAQIERLSLSLVNKLLHEPTIRLKEKAHDGQAAEYAALIRDLFGLE